MRNNMITKKLIKFALLFFLIGLTACDNKLNPDLIRMIMNRLFRLNLLEQWMQWLVASE